MYWLIFLNFVVESIRMNRSSSKKGVQLFVSHLVKFNIKHIVFSPGSRNAPLVIAIRNNNFFETVVIPDERSAAFFALGMAQQLDEPVVLICTSGSAVLNYGPAVAEAFYQNIPLILVSADRPSDWIDQGDGQTIRQKDVLVNHVRYFTELRENHLKKNDILYNSREISSIIAECNGIQKGPVHINFPFTEPLYEVTDIDEEVEAINPFHIAETKASLTQTAIFNLERTWENAEKILILVGQHHPDDRLKEALRTINKIPNVAVMVENTSNMIDRDFIHCIDRTLDGIRSDKYEEFRPDLLITIGGAVVSKKIKKFFRNNPPKHLWRVNESFPFMDTYQSMTYSIDVNDADFIFQLETFNSNVSTNFGAKWKQIDFIQQEKAQNYISGFKTFCDLKVYDLTLDCIPDGAILHLGNSSVVRYSQLFNPIFTIKYYCNRGTSGIDGSLSTAIGASYANGKLLNVAIVGDMSFFYDSNALWNNLKVSNLRIFVINNGGGDIFNIIPGPSTTAVLNENFVYKHAFTAEGICKSYGVKYYSANSLEEIENQMGDFFSEDENGIRLMEIFTNSASNSEELKKFLHI